MKSDPGRILKDLPPLAAKHHSLRITTMPTKQQRTLHDAWSQPNKRRRLDNDSDPNKIKKPRIHNQTSRKSPNTRSKKPLKPSTSLSKPPTTKRKHSLPNPSNPNPNPNPPTTNSPKIKTKTKTAPTTSPPRTTRTPTLRLTKQRTSLFAAPPSTLLLHATNCRGTWGAGIALQFRKLYPTAFTLYQTHCRQASQKLHPRNLLGTALLIPPQLSSASKSEREAGHWIGCLFTSENVGKRKDGKGEILEATRGAVVDLVRQVGELGEDWGGVGEVRMCKINSGLFGVPWEETRGVVEGAEVGREGGVREVVVCSLD